LRQKEIAKSNMAEAASPTKRHHPQRLSALLDSLHEEIDALQLENRILRERLAMFEGREAGTGRGEILSAGLLPEQLPIDPAKTSRSVSQRLQAAYQVCARVSWFRRGLVALILCFDRLFDGLLLFSIQPFLLSDPCECLFLPHRAFSHH
jgi:regulator of replication initiation timing